MENSKEKMTQYLEKFQTYQRMLQGMGSVHVEFVTLHKQISSVTLHIFPDDKDGKQLKDDKGEPILVSFKIGIWSDDAEQIMKGAHDYVTTLTAMKR